LLLSGM